MALCYRVLMDFQFKYRGRMIDDDDVAFINQLIEENPCESRYALSKKLCCAWNWVQPNGTLKDMVCRGLMLELDRAGHIKLPPAKQRTTNPFVDRKKPGVVKIHRRSVEGRLSELRPLTFSQVRRTPDEKIFNSLIEQYHYLGYCQPVGEQLKYMVYAGKRPIACFAWSSAPRHIGCRDRFIGWSQNERKRHIHLIAYNTRFLILPWVRIRHLASHLLGRMSKIVAKDWSRLYHHPVFYLETFVDKERCAGTCYKAANWIYLGQTKGRGKLGPAGKQSVPINTLWVYPLHRSFREVLTR